MEAKEDTTRNDEREHGHDENSAGDEKKVIEDTAVDKDSDNIPEEINESCNEGKLGEDTGGEVTLEQETASIISDEDLQLQAFDVVYNAFAQILEIDTASIKKDTDFFEEGGGSLQICELQDYLSKDNGQDPKLRHKLEQ